MVIPHRIRITRKISYEVVFVDRFDDPDQLGECWREGVKPTYRRQIKLKKGMSRLMTERVFWHEVLHAFDFEFKIGIPHTVIYELQDHMERFMRLNGLCKAARKKKKRRS